MQTIDQIQRRYRQEIKAQAAAGDMPMVVELRSQLGLMLFQHERWKQAAREYDRAAKLALDAEQTAVSAHLYYAQGTALQQLPRKKKAAKQAFKKAITLYRQNNNAKGIEKARQQLAEAHLQRRDVDGALTAVGDLTNLPPEQQITRLRRRAAIYMIAEQHEQAAALLQQAADLAVDDAALLLEIELEQQVVFSGKEESTDFTDFTDLEQKKSVSSVQSVDKNSDPFAALLNRALDLGKIELIASIQLEQAAAAFVHGEWETAVTHAESARDNALQSTELTRYVTYLVACLLIALSREHLQDDVGVLDILLTCKGTLTRYLSPQIGQQFNTLLDALLPRWGEERFGQALAKYRRRTED